MTTQLKPVIEPGTITHRGRRHGYAKQVHTLGPEAAQYTDSALMHYCDDNPCFGGEVQRFPDRVEVTIYID